MEREEEEKLETLLKWATENGISDTTQTYSDQSFSPCLGHSLSVSYFPNAGGRGLAAERDLRRGELVLRVPKSALLTSQSVAAKDHRLHQALTAHSSSLSPVQILAVCLLYEMGKRRGSFWYPFLMNLPSSYSILSTFGEFERRAMQVEEAVWEVEKAVSKAESEWKEARAVMKELKLKPRLVGFRAWLWASATISSRTLHVPWDEAGCLCPVGDLFNYAAPDSNEGTDDDATEEQLDSHSQRLTDGGFEEDTESYCIYARRHYKKGEQVLLAYGMYTNLELLEHYGFMLNENPNEKVFIPLEPEIYSSSTWPKESMYIHGNGKPSFALLSALRILTTPQNLRRSLAHLAYSGSQLSPENEILVARRISEKCNALLKSLPTSSEADSLVLNSISKLQHSYDPSELGKILAPSSDEIRSFFEAHGLRDGDPGVGSLLSAKVKLAMDKLRLAIQWRLGYKQILINCISHCSEVINSFICQNSKDVFCTNYDVI